MSILGGIFDYDSKAEQLVEVSRELESPAVWDDPERAQKLGQERVSLERIVTTLSSHRETLSDAKDLLELAVEEQDQETFDAVQADLAELEAALEKLEFQRMFSGKLDMNSAYLDIQSGSGGTEAQDWADMILRMYLRWGESHDYKVNLIEVSGGEVAGIKSATIHFEGEYAFGMLRTETGIHRLVRKSPFDSGARRHTSFASVFVYPEVDDNIDIEINPSDLRVDQHINKTDSAVRITHLPTNTVVQCQNQRSQHQNRDNAMNQLRAKLYELELMKQNEEKKAAEEAKSDIGWGSQIRSYVLDQSRIKDLRTNVETGNTQAVLDGDLDQFIEASLKSGL